MSPGSARTGGGKGKQKSLCPTHGTKAAASAIPPKLTFKTSARLRVPSYAPRWITGGIPVGPYLAYAVRSALRSPFAGRSPPHFHHRGLSEGPPRRLLLSVTGLICLLVVIIRRRPGFVNPFLQEISAALKQESRGRMKNFSGQASPSAAAHSLSPRG